MKSTQALFKGLRRRLRLTTKQVNKGYYKGTRTGSMGRHTKHGGYLIEPSKVRTYVVPPTLSEFKLTPFVTKRMEPLKGKFSKGESPLSGELYMHHWRKMGSGI